MSNEMTVSFAGGRRVVASYDGFEIATDQPEKAGGCGSAPEPFDLFLASLATCVAFYVLRFCQKRDIPTDGVRVIQSWQRDGKGRIETIAIRIEVQEDFPEKYHGALVRAADQCSVKKTILAPPEFVVTTAVAPVVES
jgi:ribosomal protein S12 methylthiotransferase accessory factor